jgi:osmoprotectant transport system ATP-binding protein
MIRIEHLKKIYSGSTAEAVNDLSFTVPTGEICTLVGPSGCGKTTTLKMVNRLIEPTSGAIYLPDDDGKLVNVMDVNPIQLRRKIGYVIQQIGLFPHRTIQENIGTVPKLLGWDKKKIRRRAEELLEMMNMPLSFLERYPHELSGGQRQRIGVARGMAVDPPIMLMDEPFGAIDPINRNLLQNEFLRLQKEIKKTILFVTHDIDEAIKMSDKICILNVGGHLEQYDSPANILSSPNNEFVENFVGADRALKQLNLIRVDDIMDPDPPLLLATRPAEDALAFMRERDIGSIFVVDAEKRLKGSVIRRDLRGKSGQVSEFIDSNEMGVELSTTLRDALSEMLMLDLTRVCIIDGKNRVHGLVSIEMIQKTIAESNMDDDDDNPAESGA